MTYISASQYFLGPPNKITGRKSMPIVPKLMAQTNKPAPLPKNHNFVSYKSFKNANPYIRDSRQVKFTSTLREQTLKPLDPYNQPADAYQQAPALLTSPSQFDQILDFFLSESYESPLLRSLENAFQQYFSGASVFLWSAIPELGMLYEPNSGSLIAQNHGLVGYSYQQREIMNLANPTSHASYSSSIDSKLCNQQTAALLFPLIDYNDNVFGIVEVIKSNGQKEFENVDIEFSVWFSQKFKLLSKWMKPSATLEISQFANDLLKLLPTEQYLKHVQTVITQFFDCKSFEVWKMQKDSNQLKKFSTKIETVQSTNAGFVNESILKQATVNLQNVLSHSMYAAETDGNQPQAVLALPIQDLASNYLFSIVLRGPQKNKIFTKIDESNLKILGPLILIGLENAQSYMEINNDFSSSTKEREGLQALLQVAVELSSQLNTNKLIELIMEKGQELTNADRCSLFLVDDSRQKLKTSFYQGLKEAIELPIEKGIVGKTVSEAKIFNISDVQKCSDFDSTIDKLSGYTTKSILSVPIYNNRAEIIGVTQMVNKKSDGGQFSSWDEQLIQVFNVFCGISLDNSKLFKEAIERDNQLRSFFDSAFAMAKSESLQKILSELMNNAKHSIGAERATIFLTTDKSNELSTFIADGEKMPNVVTLDKGIYAQAAKTKAALFVNDAYNDSNFDSSIDSTTGYKTKSLLATPILAPTGDLIGVVEMLNKNDGNFNSNDLQVINAFATFCSIVLERNNKNKEQKDVSHDSDVDIEMKKYVMKEEMDKQGVTPERLRLSEDEMNRVSSLNCFAVDFKGIGHFKEVFFFFNHFHLLETYKVTNQQFFRFLFAISQTYNQVPYHNWTHACDVMQYIFYLSTTSHFDQRLTSLELYAMFIAAVCHDANHQGFNNVFNVKAETPLGILFKDQSVMEMHHIEQSIPIIARDDINLFNSLDYEDTKKIWNIFVKTILATDMAHHFELVKKAQGLLDEGKWNWDETEVRILALQLVIKVAGISNVSRPFEIADKWCDILNNEFFRQGDLEKSTGIGLTSPLNDREHADKPKSQIGFYNFICLPLYTAVAKIFPELQVNVDSLKANLEHWKELAAQKAASA